MNPKEPDGEQIRSAAFRLKHDLGKPIRWNAPADREAESEALRSRLRLDVGATRVRNGRTLSAAELFEEWLATEGCFLSAPEFTRDLAALAGVMERVRSLMNRIETLDRRGLVELDLASCEISELCKALYRSAAAELTKGHA